MYRDPNLPVEEPAPPHVPTYRDDKLVGEAFIQAVVGAIEWVESTLASIRAGAAQVIIDNINEPWKLTVLLAGSLAVELLFAWVWDQLKGLEWIIKTLEFLSTIGSIIATTLAFFQVDTIILLIQLGAQFDLYIDGQLKKIYKALGSLSKELNRDFSFVSSFAEINKVLLYTANRMLPNPWLKTQAEYATGLSTFLGGVKTKLSLYIKNPENIFSDLSDAISKQRLLTAEGEVGTLAAEVSKVAAWIAFEGKTAIEGIDKLFAAVSTIDPQILKAFQTWFDPFQASYYKWKNEVYDPLSRNFDILRASFDSVVENFGIDIRTLKTRVDDPMDWILRFLGLPEQESTIAARMLREKLQEQERKEAGDIIRAVQPFLETEFSRRSILDIISESTFPAVGSVPAIEGSPPVESSLPPTWFQGEGGDSMGSESYGGVQARSWYRGE